MKPLLLWYHLLQCLTAKRQQNPPPALRSRTPGGGSCRSKGTIEDRQAARQDSAQQLCATGALPSSWGCWGPRAAPGSSKAAGGTQHKHSACPPSTVGAATNNPSIERPHTPAHLRLHEPVADKANVSRWRALPSRGNKPAFVSAKAKLALGKRLDSSTTGVCALAAFHMEVSNPRADDSRSLQRSLYLACPAHEKSWGSHCRSSLM